MPQKCILFDLDGTLTDSGEGIINCARKTMTDYGLPLPHREDMRFLVGPPLRTSFPQLGFPAEKVEEAIIRYRQYYTATGLWENAPYPGIEKLLQDLIAAGHRLFVATSKPESMACAVLNKFGLSSYFEHICGSAADGIRDKKEAVITYLLEKIGDAQNVIMVGDTKFDVLGAKALSIPTIGVTWGYGSAREMLDAGAIALTDTMDGLFELLDV